MVVVGTADRHGAADGLHGRFLRCIWPRQVRNADQLALPMGGGKTSPISAVDAARAVAVILDDPVPHIGKIDDLTGSESVDLEHYARVFTEALGRTIRYRDVPRRVERKASRGGPAGACRPPPHGDDGAHNRGDMTG